MINFFIRKEWIQNLFLQPTFKYKIVIVIISVILFNRKLSVKII